MKLTRLLSCLCDLIGLGLLWSIALVVVGVSLLCDVVWRGIMRPIAQGCWNVKPKGNSANQRPDSRPE